MKLLLDTHTFLWWAIEPPAILELMKNPANKIVFSVVSAWEAQIKIGLGKLTLSESLKKIVEREIQHNKWEILPVSLQHVWHLLQLPPLHKDPFDRLLIAQALTEDLTIATGDAFITNYPGLSVIW